MPDSTHSDFAIPSRSGFESVLVDQDPVSELNKSCTLIALLVGPDRPGLVAQVARWIADAGGNILHADQHRDDEEEIFFQRVEWTIPGRHGAEHEEGFRMLANDLGMRVQIADASARPRIALMVSQQEHCFHDLMLRGRAGELPGAFVCVLSNHPDLGGEAAHYGVPFHHIPISPKDRESSEQEQLRRILEHGSGVVVLARYMQILSAGLLDELAARDIAVINIHHSFLPAFAGARPYHQAFRRGVKIIGATAHYATAVLDDGPIIHQAVAPVTHRHSLQDLIRSGRDLEKTVLAQALRWHLEHRVLTYGKKTVVFD